MQLRPATVWIAGLATVLLVAAHDVSVTAPLRFPGTVVPQGEVQSAAPVPEYEEPAFVPVKGDDEAPTRFEKRKPTRTLSRAHARARKTPKATQVHEGGKHYSRRIAKNLVMYSGDPDPWFAALMKVEPEDLTLDQVEDMTDLEIIDYVGLFNWGHAPPSTNVVKVLRRREAIAQMKRRRRPGDEFEEHIPLSDTAGAHDIATIGEPRLPSQPEPGDVEEDEASKLGVPRPVPPEDRLMSHPRWHLAKEEEHIQSDPYYAVRRTSRKRPTVHHQTLGKAKVVETLEATHAVRLSRSMETDGNSDSGDASSSGSSATTRKLKVKRAVIPTIDMDDISKVKEGDDVPKYRPNRHLSTVPRKAGSSLGTRKEREAFRAQYRQMPADKRIELHHQSDPGRCYESAAEFCGGLSNDFASFISCTLKNLHKFGSHDEHCREDYPQYYGPCAEDMAKFCKGLDSFETLRCLVKLAKSDAQALEADGIEGSEGERRLSGECLASESMEIISGSMGEQDREWELSDKERRMIYKYQQFWVSQQQENLSEEELRDYREHDVVVQVKEAHEDEFPDTGFGDAFDKDEDM